jgi:hypothetical protein
MRPHDEFQWPVILEPDRWRREGPAISERLERQRIWWVGGFRFTLDCFAKLSLLSLGTEFPDRWCCDQIII